MNETCSIKALSAPVEKNQLIYHLRRTFLCSLLESSAGEPKDVAESDSCPQTNSSVFALGCGQIR